MSKCLVILDNGHGVETPGKRSPIDKDGKQLFEWEYCRRLSQAIKERLNANNIAATIIVPETKDVPLTTRASRANKEYANAKKRGMTAIMVSIHLNAAGSNGEWSKATGWEVWSTTAKNNSDKLAKAFTDCYKEIIQEKKLRGAKEKDYTVLYKTNCPCVLTENFFMDGTEDYKFLQSEEGFNKIVELHTTALLNYIKTI